MEENVLFQHYKKIMEHKEHKWTKIGMEFRKL
jgi:hypothetical protein